MNQSVRETGCVYVSERERDVSAISSWSRAHRGLLSVDGAWKEQMSGWGSSTVFTVSRLAMHTARGEAPLSLAGARGSNFDAAAKSKRDTERDLIAT